MYTHGRQYAYKRAGCRCDLCVEWARKASNDYKQRRRDRLMVNGHWPDYWERKAQRDRERAQEELDDLLERIETGEGPILREWFDSDEEYISAMTVRSGDCLLWRRVHKHKGYGVGTNGVRAHRLVWTILVGPIPPGHHVHHECENETCVNIEHLRCVTPAEHVALHR